MALDVNISPLAVGTVKVSSLRSARRRFELDDAGRPSALSNGGGQLTRTATVAVRTFAAPIFFTNASIISLRPPGRDLKAPLSFEARGSRPFGAGFCGAPVPLGEGALAAALVAALRKARSRLPCFRSASTNLGNSARTERRSTSPA